MRLRINVIVQVLMTVLQIYNQISDFLPGDWQDLATAVMTIIQGVVALLAHFSNPDGTKVTVAYVKPVKKLDI